MGDDFMDVHGDDGDFEDGERVAPVEQMIMVGCWLSMKEVPPHSCSLFLKLVSIRYHIDAEKSHLRCN